MLKIDLHIHTSISKDSQNTLLEYINQAKKLKMKVIGISNHGPKTGVMMGGEVHFRSMARVPKTVEGVRVLKGIEANIIDKDGSTDITERIFEKLDYAMASFHQVSLYKRGDIKTDTRAMIETIKSGRINIITHPYVVGVDIEKVAEAACKNNVLLEIDNNYLKADYLPDIIKMIEIVRKHKDKIIIGGDAHNIWELGDDSKINKIKKEIGLTEDLIINNYQQELFKRLNIKE